jgi:hypothetical protein
LEKPPSRLAQLLGEEVETSLERVGVVIFVLRMRASVEVLLELF